MLLNEILIQSKRIYTHLSAGRKRQIILLCLLMIMSLLAEILTIGAILPFLAVLTSPEIVYKHPMGRLLGESLNLQQSSDFLLPVTVFFCVAALVAGLVRFLLLWYQANLSRVIGADFSVQAYERTLYQPYSFHVLRNSSEVLAGTTKAGGLVGSFVQPIFTLTSSLLVVFGVLLALLVINPVIALSVLLGFGLIYALILSKSKYYVAKNSHTIAMHQGKVNKVIQEGLGGIRDVLIDGTQPVYAKLYREAITPMQKALASNQVIGAGPRFGVEVLGMILIASLAYIFQAVNNFSLSGLENGVSINSFSTVPALGALALGAQRLLPLLQQIYQSLISIRGSQASTQDALSMLDQLIPFDAQTKLVRPMNFQKSIRLKDLSFSYSSNSPIILHKLNLEIPKGSKVGIVGNTGSGKSTLTDIVMGLLVPSDGKLFIDNNELTIGNVHSWRMNISHVPQAIFLSDASIAENIAFGTLPEKIDMTRIRHAAKQAQISDTIEKWPDKYNTMVGERGVRLSGGQRQRIGIARALYKNAKVIVFDEATSALDNETEIEVMNAIGTLGSEVTVLMVAHRITTLKSCDFIIELVDGEIRSINTYRDIIQRME